MRIIIFTSHQDATGIHNANKGSLCLHGNSKQASMDQFFRDENAVLIATPDMAEGWEAPLGTKIIFTSEFPRDAAMMLQAKNRSKRFLHG